ncbi:cyclase family protein [Oscillibacter sp.]|uniref:cyclase family protein n=1 Tax=Oscillibacter sp. TaxID=1945593 RepID=UPI0028A1C292|nr:cyclase family protein [Oscillibacter sp.]
MILDLTHTIREDMPVYPGTSQPVFQSTGNLTRNGYRETLLQFASHTGTHMDAPSHILSHGSTLDVLPVSQFCGRAAVVDVSALAPGEVITAEFLRSLNGAVLSTDFILFYTGWEKRWGTDAYFEDTFPVPDKEAAQYLVSCGLKGVGTDALSVDTLATSCRPVHKVLLGGGLVIVESLCLKKVVGRKDMMFFALPMKFMDADGAPVRAIAEFRDFSEKEEISDP